VLAFYLLRGVAKSALRRLCEAERAKTISSSNLNAAGRMEAGDIGLRGCMMGKGLRAALTCARERHE
jgi:hypothetical protein